MRAIGLLSFALIVATGCKDRGSQESSTKDVEDTQQINFIPSENKFFVICRDDRRHLGQKNALVTKEQLKDVCEEVAPGGTGNSGNTGTSGAPTDFTSCPNVPEKVKALNVAFSPAFLQQSSQLAPALAKQQLCVGLLTGLKNMVAASATLFSFLTGEKTGAPVLIIIDGKDTPVSYEAENFALTLPSKINQQTNDLVEKALADQGVSFCSGKRALGACWFLTQPGAGCDVTCTASGLSYDDQTRTLVGSEGSLANCQDVGKLFGFAPGGDTSCGGGLSGCFFNAGDGNATRRCASPQTVGNANASGYTRICACQ